MDSLKPIKRVRVAYQRFKHAQIESPNIKPPTQQFHTPKLQIPALKQELKKKQT
ncbi:hypothetical protein [Pelagicoccus enzymogenes]|uniref:hypothetical protein n=1 Tax=Pelagicoccus enzymogenes TaxID=2773457 RepID=UPI0028124D77|nr:hypothetical protein [Pelagicoccus enzymogenes]